MTQPLHFLLRQHFERAVLLHLLKRLEAVDTALDRLEVRHHAAEPTLVDIEHIRTQSLLTDCLLRLLLRTDEEDGLALLRNAAEEVVRLVHLAHRLLQVDDVDAVALREDVTCHLRIPAARLMPEVDTCLQKLLHRNYCHGKYLLLFFHVPHLPNHRAEHGTERLSGTRDFFRNL